MMTALSLDYCRKGSVSQWAGRAILVLSIVVMILAGFRYHHLRQEIQKMESAVDSSLNARNQTMNESKDTDPKLVSEIERATRVSHEIQASWNNLFDTLESVQGPHIALLTLEIEGPGLPIQISGEARDFESMTHYWQTLRAQPVFSDVRLDSHVIRVDDPLRPIQFHMEAILRNTS